MFQSLSRLTIKNRQQMKNLAAEIAAIAQIGDIIGLEGDLGMGKSFFAAAFINSLLDKKIIIPSPTFNLLYSYISNSKGKRKGTSKSKNNNIYHFDLYRIKNKDELDNIGIRDYLNDGISLIEWPKIAQDLFGKTYLEIIISAGKATQERIIEFKADKYWIDKLKNCHKI